MDLDQEKDYIILLAIAINGYSAMPQDYSFLNRYALKNLYFEILINSTSRRDIRHLEKAAMSQARMFLPASCDFQALRTYKEVYGNKGARALLGENPTYWKVFQNVLRKKSHEYNSFH